MNVQKRNGDCEEVSFDKVLKRIKLLSHELHINVFEIAQKVCSRIYDGVKTSELDELAAHMCSSLTLEHPDYGVMASRIIVSNHHKNTSPSFSETVQILYDNVDTEGKHNPLVSQELYDVVQKHKEKLNSYIDYNRDYGFDYFGFKTLEKAYLMRVKGRVVERPQQMFMRVALGIHAFDIKDALETYDLMSKKYFVHATPTLFNAGTPRPQCSSCFLLASTDSINGIYDSLKECALISKYAGGIGLHIHDIRARNSIIRGTNGTSTGIVPMLRVFNNTARYVNQCVTPDKLVFTKDGIKRMDQVTTNDYLITHDGSFKKVNSVAINEKHNDELVVIDVRHATHPLKCTKVHEILVINTGNPEFCFRDVKRKLDNGGIVPTYVPAEKVTTNHLMVYPIPTYVKDISYLYEDDLRLYGIMIGDGSINVHNNQWSVNINTTSKILTGLFVKELLQKRNIQYSEYIDENVHYITWTQTAKIPFGYENLYDKNKEKKIDSQLIHLPTKKLCALLKGLIETDGYVTDSAVYYGSTSLDVIQSMKYMLLRVGILTSVNINDNVDKVVNIYKGKEIISTKINYDLRIPKIQDLKDLDIFSNFDVSQYALYYKYENWLLSKVTDVSRMRYSGKVYDFNMMDNHNYLTDSGLIHNSGRRNGSIAIYLEPWHADIESFLELRKNHGNEEERARDLFYALWIPDLFMQRVKEDGMWSLMCPDICKGLSDHYGEAFEKLYTTYEDKKMYLKQIKAQDLWFQILESQIETGTPYMLYKDHVNRKNNQKNLGTIKSSNLCVAPETMILTDKGYFPIHTLRDQMVHVWNGKEFSETVVRQTGVRQKLITVSCDNGMSVRCTPYHKFYVQDLLQGVRVVEAGDLQVGMSIIRYEIPTMNMSSADIKFPYTQGVYAAEGTHDGKCGPTVDRPCILLKGDKRKLLQNMDWVHYNNIETDQVQVIVQGELNHKYFVPINYNLKSKLRWLEGFLDSSGFVKFQNGVEKIFVYSMNETFLIDVVYMLQTMGIQAKIQFKQLEIDSIGIAQLKELGFTPKHLVTGSKMDKMIPKMKSEATPIRISGVVDKGEVSNTYCFNEPLEHKGIFNGLLLGNCSEITEFTSEEETAVCNLASLCLPSYIENGTYNFKALHDAAKVLVKNINKIIDRNFYPVEKAKVSNMRHRPIGLGVQGLADAYVLMRYPFDSDEARALNRDIFETIYHGALEASMELAKKLGKTYSSFKGSPASEGMLQFDLWGVTPSDRYDWTGLKHAIMEFGLLNSLLIAPMPTASTSQIMGFNEAFEPFTSNIYKRKTLAGEFILVNKYLVKDLQDLGLWNTDMKNKIILDDGSIQGILEIPQNIRDLYKIVWEIKQKVVIDQAADRGAFVDQSMSMNLFMESPDFKKLSSMHFYAWQKGLKTGMYYLRTKAKAKAQQFTMDPKLAKFTNLRSELPNSNSHNNSTVNSDTSSETGGCEACSA